MIETPERVDVRTITPTPRAVRRAAAGGVALLATLQVLAGFPLHDAAGGVAPRCAALRLDPNIASREDLMLLPRIGPTLADYIVEYRESCAPRRAFTCAEDLARVHRIGPLTVEKLRPHLRFGVDDVQVACRDEQR